MVFLSVSLTLGVVFAECSPFCSCGGQLYHRGERSQGEGSYVPLGSGGGGEPGPLRLHQAQNHAHVSGLLEVHVCLCVLECEFANGCTLCEYGQNRYTFQAWGFL